MQYNEQQLDHGFVLKHPVWYGAVLVLAFAPHFVVDYQTCFLVVQQSNPQASLLNFIRHVLIEKFALSVLMTVTIFGGLYLLSWWFTRLGRLTFPNQIKLYLIKSVLVILISYVVYGLLHVLILNFFPSHHPQLEDGRRIEMIVFHFIHFNLLFVGLMLINVIKSLIAVPVRKIEVQDRKGKRIVDVGEIDWVVKAHGIYELKTESNAFRTERPISHFETILNRQDYIRINRAAIVRKTLIKGYNYWEHDKYILRVGREDEKEFIVSRQRMKTIRDVLTNDKRRTN